MKTLINESLTNIFAEINKIRDMIYEQIKNKNMSTSHDILEAMCCDTDAIETFKEFEIHGRQFDVNRILAGIEDYTYYDIERFVDRDQWSKDD